MTTYYVEPDYWEFGYAVGDYSGTFVFGSARSSAQSTLKSAGNYTVTSHRERATATSSMLAGPILITVYPGVNLNSKSAAVVAGATTINSNAGLIEARSTSLMTGRVFWENTSPASGSWTLVVPQAEGTGK